MVLVDGIEVAAGVTSGAFEARVRALEEMVVANKIAAEEIIVANKIEADAKVSALEAKLIAIDADLKSTTTSTTTTVTSSTQSSTTVTISTTTASTTTTTTVTSTSISTTTIVDGFPADGLTFTSCGSNGMTGPTQDECTAFYKDKGV